MTGESVELSIDKILGGPADSRTLAATVAQRLRSLILSGQLQPGMSLRLAPLANSLDVSVMPVREALRRLEAEGLVVLMPRRGAVVAELSIEDAEEIYALRIGLEALCARHAAERLTDADVAELETLFGRMEAAQEAGDLDDLIDRDHSFHAYLYALSGRQRLTRMIAELQDRSRRYLPSYYRAWELLENPVEAHAPILDAIRTRDPAVVERLTREHMEQAAGRLLAVLAVEAEDRKAARSVRPRRAGARAAGAGSTRRARQVPVS